MLSFERYRTERLLIDVEAVRGLFADRSRWTQGQMHRRRGVFVSQDSFITKQVDQYCLVGGVRREVPILRQRRVLRIVAQRATGRPQSRLTARSDCMSFNDTNGYAVVMRVLDELIAELRAKLAPPPALAPPVPVVAQRPARPAPASAPTGPPVPVREPVGAYHGGQGA